MVSPIKSILGQNPVQGLLGYETTADLAIFTITILSFYLLIYPNFENWTKKQVKTVFKASTPYLGTTAVISSISAQQGTPLGLTAITCLAIIFFAVSINRKDEILGLKGLYQETLLGALVLGFTFQFVQLPEIYSIGKLLVLSTASITSLFAVLAVFDLRRDGMIFLPIWAHFLDAASTVIALENSFSESRLLARIFIELLGPYGIFLMKALIIVPLTFYAVRALDGKHALLSVYIITALGLILGIRNILMV